MDKENPFSSTPQISALTFSSNQRIICAGTIQKVTIFLVECEIDNLGYLFQKLHPQFLLAGMRGNYFDFICRR